MEPFQLFRPVEFQLSFVACFSQLGQATGTIYSLNESFTPRPWGCRHVRPVRQLGVNLPKTAGQKHKQYPRFQVEIRGISFHLFPQVAGGLCVSSVRCDTLRYPANGNSTLQNNLSATPTRWQHFCRPVIPVAPSFQCRLEPSAAR